MAGIDSRAKGAAAEREAAKVWAEVMGCEARRGQQFSGGKESPDVVQSISGIHLEVKRVERGNPYAWMAQAIYDAGDQVPVVIHRKNRSDWLCIVRLNDVPRLIQACANPKTEAVGGGAVPADVPSQGVSPSSPEDEQASWVFRHG